MPKQPVLRKKINIKSSNWRKTYSYTCKLDWEGQFLKYNYIGWKSIDLSKASAWKMGSARTVYSKKRKSDIQVQSMSLTLKEKKKETVWTLEIIADDFNNWLYWLVISLLKYSDNVFSDADIKGLSLGDSRKIKLQSQRTLANFDMAHQIFVNAANRVSKDLGLSKSRTTGENQTQVEFGKKIKKGGQGAVFFAKMISTKDSSNIPLQPVVIKSVSAGTSGYEGLTPHQEAIIKEARLLAAAGPHPNIVSLIDAVATKGGFFLYLEKCDYELQDIVEKEKLSKLTPKRVFNLTKAILSGMCHLHDHHIYHLDIKPENIMIHSNKTPKIIDLGLGICRLIHSKEDAEKALEDGTQGYKGPENWDAFPVNAKWSKIAERFEKRDSFAVGMTILNALIAPLYKIPDPYNALFGKGKAFGKLRDAEVDIVEFWEKTFKDKISANPKNNVIDDIVTLCMMMIKSDTKENKINKQKEQWSHLKSGNNQKSFGSQSNFQARFTVRQALEGLEMLEQGRKKKLDPEISKK